MTILDQTRDANGQHLYGLLNTVDGNGTKLFNPPDFVKSASAEDLCGKPGQPTIAYGDPMGQMFTCHTAPATWVSAVFFHTQKSAMTKQAAEVIEKRIDAAARHHGISSMVGSVKDAVARTMASSDEARPDSDFALVIEFDGGRKERHLRISNQSEVKAACAYLRQYAGEFQYSDRRVIAEKTITKAASLGVPLGEDQEFLEKTAGQGSCAPETAVNLISSRSRAVRLVGRDPTAADELDKIAQAFRTDPDLLAPSSLQKLAGLIDRVDREYKLQGLTELKKPEDVLFRVTIKSAQQVLDDHVSLTSGTVYSKQALAGVSLSEIEAVMGTRFAGAVSDDGVFLDAEKLAEAARTMPRNDAELFDSLMSRMQVQPAYKEAAHSGSGPLAAAGLLNQLAGLHR